jgi:hypothetical protein
MKKIIILVFFIILTSCQNTSKKKPELELSTYIYDYGDIKNDSLYNGSAILKNTGSLLLKIDNISADCACTNLSLNKNEIQPGDTCLLSFTYNTFSKEGEQENYIFITANTDSVIHILQINAYVK